MLQGGVKFSKLDMSNAYLQLEVDDKTKEILTVNTHLGLYQVNRLPFGIKQAPGIFQQTLELLLKDIDHVCIYLDDILVSVM